MRAMPQPSLSEPPLSLSEPQAPSPSLSELHEDAKRVVLQQVDVGSLIKFKCVNQLWRKLARNELCSRLCRREGAQITDINLELLDSAGRPWEAATAGRLLPGLARLHGYGFLVDVAAVRGVDLTDYDIEEEEEEEEMGFLCVAAKAALRRCITGEGEPPVELLLAAVACAGVGDAGDIPVGAMRADGIEALDLSEKGIDEQGAMLIARLVPVMASLTNLS